MQVQPPSAGPAHTRHACLCTAQYERPRAGWDMTRGASMANWMSALPTLTTSLVPPTASGLSSRPLSRHPDDAKWAGSVRGQIRGPGSRGARADHCDAAAVALTVLLPPSHPAVPSTITPCTQQGSLTREPPPRVASRSSSSSTRFSDEAPGPGLDDARAPPLVEIVDGSLPGQCVCN